MFRQYLDLCSARVSSYPKMMNYRYPALCTLALCLCCSEDIFRVRSFYATLQHSLGNRGAFLVRIKRFLLSRIGRGRAVDAAECTTWE